MINCWQNEPKARPSFTALTKQLKEMENQHKVRLLLTSDIKLISVTSAECNDNNCSAINHFEVAQETGSRWFQSGTVNGDVFPHGGKFVLQNSSPCTLIT